MEGPNDTSNKAKGKEWPSIPRPYPTMDEDALVVFILDGVAANSASDYVDSMPSADELQPLRKCLALGPTGKGVKIANDETNPQRPIHQMGHGSRGPWLRVRV